MLLQPKDGSRNLTNALIDTLSESIYSCVISPGEKLPSEAMIVAEYGVSRTVVREAIRSLKASGLIETRHGVGSFVRAVPMDFRIDKAAVLTIRDVMDMLDLRISLETEAAALAAARRTEAQIEEMRRALNCFKANLGSVNETAKPDFQFHQQIAYSTGNRYFGEVMTYLGTNTIPRTRVDVHQSSEGELHYLSMLSKEHESIFDAILHRDPEGARSAMRAHLVSSRARLRRAHDLAAEHMNPGNNSSL